MRYTTNAAIETIRHHPKTAGGADGNRGGFRFSFGSAFMMGLIEPPASMAGWHALAEAPSVLAALKMSATIGKAHRTRHKPEDK